MQHIKHLSISMLLSFALVACATIQPLEEKLSKEEIINAIKPGDTITIVTKNGDQHSIKVFSVTEEKIIGGGKQIKLEDVELIEIVKFTTAGKAGMVLGVIGVVYILGLIVDSLIIIEIL